MLIINDIHIGFRRVGGTTPESQEALRSRLVSVVSQIIQQGLDDNEPELVILGDLFDDFEVSMRDWLDTYILLYRWLWTGRRLTLVAGNHDHSPRANKVSSFQALATALREIQGVGDLVDVIGIDKWDVNGDGVAIVAHCSNQDLFNQNLDEVLEVNGVKALLLHANFDNKFAAQTDHSLNVSREMAQRFIDKGVTLYFAHEHQARTEMGGKVVVFGNQFPTSIADCLGNTKKFYHYLTRGTDLVPVSSWSKDDWEHGFAEIDWRALADLEEAKTGFVRVTGEATSAEASQVINVIAQFRQRSKAYVITNAVAIDGIIEAEALPESFEAAKRFDVMEFIERHLDAEQMAVVRKLMERMQ